MRKFITLLCLALLAGTMPLTADDPGYFLSWQQKKDLLSLGRMQDSDGRWYDVWICPGYVPPARYASEHMKQAGNNFHEYLEATKYRSLKNGSVACFDWALKTCGWDFALKGIPNAWGENFSTAHERTQKRVFGWWMAYPWALLESTVETAFRAVLGAAGTAGGVATGLAIVPSYHALDSAVAGVWNLGVNTIIIPAVGVTWNTVIGPPLALVGQKPAESRVDGFWVTMINPDDALLQRPLTPEEVRLFAKWGLVLLRETGPLAQQQQAIRKDAADFEKKMRQEIQAAKTAAERQVADIQQKKKDLAEQLASTNEFALALRSQYPDLTCGGHNEELIRSCLREMNIAPVEINGIIKTLRSFRLARPAAQHIRPKTDPLQRSVDVIGGAALDVVK